MQPATLTLNINKLEQLYVHIRLPEISLIWIVHFEGYKYMAVDFGHQIIHLAPLQLQMLVFSHSVKCLNLQMVLIGWHYKKIGRERRVGANTILPEM